MKTKSILKPLLLLLFLTSNFAQAQIFDAQLTASGRVGGYNISCHGGNNGSIDVFITSDFADTYTFLWDDNVTSRNRYGLIAGIYGVRINSVTTGQSIHKTITLIEPRDFAAILVPNVLAGGYNISPCTREAVLRVDLIRKAVLG